MINYETPFLISLMGYIIMSILVIYNGSRINKYLKFLGENKLLNKYYDWKKYQ